MRLWVWLIALSVLLAGCAGDPADGARSSVPSELPSEGASSDADLPIDDPTQPREDSSGRTPEDAVLLLIDTLNAREWNTAYSMYATPSVDIETAARERADAGETYEGFTVLETRVASEESAFVRVTYSVHSDSQAAIPTEVTVSEPGEWWPLHKVSGVWKTQWMPRQ